MRYTLELECNLGHKDKNKCWYLNNPTNIQNYKSCWECPFHGKLKDPESQPVVMIVEDEWRAWPGMEKNVDCFLAKVYFRTRIHGFMKTAVVTCPIGKDDFIEDNNYINFTKDFEEKFRRQWGMLNIWNACIETELLSSDLCNLESIYVPDDQEARATGLVFCILGYLNGLGITGSSLSEIWEYFKSHTNKEASGDDRKT